MPSDNELVACVHRKKSYGTPLVHIIQQNVKSSSSSSSSSVRVRVSSSSSSSSSSSRSRSSSTSSGSSSGNYSSTAVVQYNSTIVL